jgi:purine-cytosine permease-like protein
MSGTTTQIESGLGEEYEHEPVPLAARKSLFAVSAVWVGFPMIMTSAVFAGIVVYNLGFLTGLAAILIGNVVLMGYVGTLSYLAGKSGKNFALTAADTFGATGFRIVSAFLSTLVIGWFAGRRGPAGAGLHWKPFAAWAIGAAVALATHYFAPQLSDAVVAMLTGGLAFTALAFLPGPAVAEAPQPALTPETA